jgi:hypothetical protein
MPTTSSLEVIFTMPQAIAGQPDAKVLCRVEIARRMSGKDGKDQHGLALEILTCEYLHERKQPQRAEAHA